MFNVPPTAKVIWRRGHGLKSHPTDWRSRESNLRPLVYKASSLSTTPQRLLGFISDPLIVSKVHNETRDPKGQENNIYTIVKGRETFYRRHTVPVISWNEVKYVLKRVSFGSKDCTKELKLECAYFMGQTS